MIGGMLIMGTIGVLLGAGLSLASKIFHVEVDPKIEAIEETLPGANCGGCGLPGCSANAEAIAKGQATADSCVAGGIDVTLAIAAIMGVEIQEKEPEISVPDCTYGCEDADLRFLYNGARDCRAAILLDGGSKLCNIGCLGLGTCVKYCLFDALHIGEDGLPVVDKNKCTGCGACEKVCPKHIISLSSSLIRIMHFNTVSDCLAPCQQRCPAQLDIPQYMKLANEGKYKEALAVIKERVPMPLSIGRVCPHPCESACRRNSVDEPVNINHIKRYCADIELHSGTRYEPPLVPLSDKRIAIVGGGPAGLACAYYLRRFGHSSTIFEAMPKLGGMLRYGIPEYRLPKMDVLDWEISGITKLDGITVEVEKKLGQDFTIQSLKNNGFDAVFLGIGCWGSRNMDVEGENLKGVLSGTQFLIQMGLDQPPKIGKRVVIIGGGNTAIDAARTSWRLGAEEVTVLYRRSRNEMPAASYEVEEAELEGIKFHFLAAPTKLIGNQDNELTGIEFLRMELGEPDESGRRKPIPVKGSETILPADNVIAAIGQFAVYDKESLKLDDSQEAAMSRWETLDVNGVTGQSKNIDWLFGAGDGVIGAATVVEALGGARKAATGIHRYLNGEIRVKDPADLRLKIFDGAIKEDLIKCHPKLPRNRMPDLHVPQRKGNFTEVETGFTDAQVSNESYRCLTCGLYCFRNENDSLS